MPLTPKSIFGYTDGIFDGCHEGHVKMIEHCRSRCDYLIVGVYSDSFTSENKGRTRPFNAQDVRMNEIRRLDETGRVILLESLDDCDRILSSGMVDMWFRGEKQTNKPSHSYKGVQNIWVKRTPGISTSLIETNIAGKDD